MTFGGWKERKWGRERAWSGERALTRVKGRRHSIRKSGEKGYSTTIVPRGLCELSRISDFIPVFMQVERVVEYRSQSGTNPKSGMVVLPPTRNGGATIEVWIKHAYSIFETVEAKMEQHLKGREKEFVPPCDLSIQLLTRGIWQRMRWSISYARGLESELTWETSTPFIPSLLLLSLTFTLHSSLVLTKHTYLHQAKHRASNLAFFSALEDDWEYTEIGETRDELRGAAEIRMLRRHTITFQEWIIT